MIELAISGMTCNHCVARTQKALEAVDGVASVTVTLEPGGAKVQGDPAPAQLLAAVKAAGYSAEVM